MTDTWAERLSEYLDGELSPAETAELERHLLECSSCRQAVAELRAVVARLCRDPLQQRDQPTLQSWGAIRQAIVPSPRRWIRTGAIAAALAGVAVAAGLWRAQVTGPAAEPVPTIVFPADYRRAAADLEAILREQRNELRPETVRAVEESLATIDSAIAQAARALAADPANEYVSRYLVQLRDIRLTALRDAVALARQRG